MVTRTWKVYGTEGHRQRESFFPSYQYDFSNEQNGTRIIEVDNFDKTGTHDYSIVRITRDTARFNPMPIASVATTTDVSPFANRSVSARLVSYGRAP